MFDTRETPEIEIEGPARQRILLCAKRLFAENGYENTSTSSISRAARTSESQIIKHFGGKEGLLEAILEEGWQRVADTYKGLDYLSSPSAKLQSLVGLILARLGDDPAMQELYLFEGRRIRRDSHLILMTAGFLSLVKVFDGLLLEMRDKGELRGGLNVQAVRSGLMGMMEGLLRDRMLANRGQYPAAYSQVEIRDVFLHMLKALSAPAPATPLITALEP